MIVCVVHEMKRALPVEHEQLRHQQGGSINGGATCDYALI